MDSCLFCEAEIADGANFCTQCGKKVLKKNTVLKKQTTKQAKQEPVDKLITELFFENSQLYCSPKQLQAFELKLQTYSYSQIQEQIQQAFLKPFNLYLRKALLKRYGQHIKKDLLSNNLLPESSKFLIA